MHGSLQPQYFPGNSLTVHDDHVYSSFTIRQAYWHTGQRKLPQPSITAYIQPCCTTDRLSALYYDPVNFVALRIQTRLDPWQVSVWLSGTRMYQFSKTRHFIKLFKVGAFQNQSRLQYVFFFYLNKRDFKKNRWIFLPSLWVISSSIVSSKS